MIQICDAIMGSGKSSAAITYMNEHPDDKFVYITPYLEEAERIKENCPTLYFAEPSNKIPDMHFSKIRHTLQLLESGRNIATTHAAFASYDTRITELIHEMNYTLIIDESVNILSKATISSCDVNALCAAGHLTVENDRYVSTGTYGGGVFSSFFSSMNAREMIRCDDESDVMFYWLLPPELLTAAKDVFVLTYLFEGQDMYGLLQMYDLPHRYIGVSRDENGVYRFCDYMDYIPEYTGTLGGHIHIFDNKKINSVGDAERALSMRWFINKEMVDQLRKNIHNYFCNIHRDEPSELRMWGTYSTKESILRGAGYAKRFVMFNERATNQYRNRTVLVYAVNLYRNVGQTKFLTNNGADADNDQYALSTMVQWIWRSAIRDGKDIYIYIPSRRMRELLIRWIAEVEERYRQHMALSVNEGGEHDESAMQ